MPIPATVLFVLFLTLSGLHVFWALSGRTYSSRVIPTVDGVPVLRPGRAATLAVAALLLAAAVVSLWRGAWPDSGASWVPHTGILVIAGVFAARAIGDFRLVGFFKRVRGTDFARNDSLVYSPLCAAVSGLALWLALAY
jgi:hypothetical protein